MARPLRIEYPGASYHILNRGNHQETVFKSPEDYKLFLWKLAYFAELFEVRIYSYCLMPNHFHLFLKTEHANLSKFMQSFLTSFSISINRKYSKTGHIFHGRYKSILVETELYKNKLSRYIHLNPVKIKGYEEFSYERLCQLLYGYEWSSYLYYIGLKKKPVWLDRRFVLSSWGTRVQEKIKNYKTYVESGIKTDNREELKPKSQIIGSEKFKGKMISEYLKNDFDDIDSREQPLLATINSHSPQRVIDAVKSYYKLSNIKKITVRKGSDRKARKVAMYLTSYFCRRKESLADLSTIFGLKLSGYTSATSKIALSIAEDSKLENDINKIKELLICKNTKTEV